jgi:hypothetical protein
MFDIKNPNSFLGGQNVHNLIIIGLLIYIIFKMMNKGSESGYTTVPKDASDKLKASNQAYQDYKKKQGK